MLTLAHLSDVHLAPLPSASLHHFFGKRFLGYVNWSRRKYVHRPEALAAIVDDLRAQGPEHVAVTGDLVNLALPAEFTAALKWLKGLGTPEDVTVVPGNHDAYVRLWRSPGYELWSDYMTSNASGAGFVTDAEAAFPFVRVLGDVALVGVSTARPMLPTVAAGRVGGPQLVRLADILAKLRQRNLLRVVLIHHPPLPGMTSWRRALHDAAELKEVLLRVGAELILHGHDHRQSLNWLEWQGGVLPIVGVPSASAALPHTRPVSPSAKPPARYNLFRLGREERGWRIEMTGRGLNGAGNKVTEIEKLVLLPSADRAITAPVPVSSV